MGMTDAFDNSASFGGISSRPLRLEDIFIKTYFSVDEIGTKVEALLSKSILGICLKQKLILLILFLIF